MSIKLMQHVRVLVVGVALTAMILTLLPGVANAKTKLDGAGKVDAALNDAGGDGGANKGDGGGKNHQGDGGGANLDGKVDAALKGDAGGNLDDKAEAALKGDAGTALGDTTVDSATRADQQVDLDDPPLVGGDTNSTTEVIAPLVPAEGEAKVDEKVEVGDLVNEDICLNAALNRNAGGCGSGTSSGSPAGSDIDTSPNINIDEILGDNAVNHDTKIKEDLLPDEGTLLDGSVDSATQVTAPALPVEGGAKVDGNVNAADKVKQDLCLTADINRNGTGCGSGGAGGSGDDIVTIPDIDTGEILEGTAADSDTTIDEKGNPNKPELDGTVNNRNDIVAPGIPASAKADLRGNATVNDLVNQDVNSCTTLNAAGCAGPAAPGNGNGGNGIDLGDILKDIDADSDTNIDETVNPDEPRLDGTLDSATDVDAPGVPASAKAELKGNAKVDELVDQDVGVCGTLNAANCKGDTTPSNGNGDNNGIDLGELPGDTTVDSVTDIDEKVNPNKPALDGTVDNRNDIVAPIVPASAVVDLDGNATVDELVDQDVNSCTTLNAAGCAGPAGSSPGDGDSTSGNDDNGDGDDRTPADDDASAPGDGSGSDDSGSGSDDNGRGSDDNGGSSDSGSSDSGNSGSGSSGSGSSDDGDELAFAAPVDRNGGGSDDNSGSSNSGNAGSGSSGSGSSDDGDELAFAAPTSGQASASSGSATKGNSLPDTGGVSPLMLIAALLFIGSGILLATKRRRFNS